VGKAGEKSLAAPVNQRTVRSVSGERVDKRERHQVLLHAARDVFAARGYHDAKVEDICARANVAKGTYYLYFKDKRAVLEELVDGLFARIGAAILRVDVEGEVRPQVEHNIRAIVAVFLDDPALTRLLLSYAAGLDPAFVQKIGSFYDSARMMLSAALREGQRLGIVMQGSPEFFATVTLGVLKEVLLEASTLGRVRPREEIVRDLFEFLQGGYLRMPALESASPPLVQAKRKRAVRAD
jgi:AcrR family transcriptional regulator